MFMPFLLQLTDGISEMTIGTDGMFICTFLSELVLEVLSSI